MRGRLVSWVEKTSLERSRRMLEIIEVEHNHELFLSVKYLWELGVSPFRYIVPVIPRLLPEKLVRGEHFVLVDLLKSIQGNSSQARFAKEPQAGIAEGALVSFVRPDQSPLAVQDPKVTRVFQEERKDKGCLSDEKKKGKIIIGQIKAIDAGLEGFVDWLDSTASDQIEERKEDMSSLVVKFPARMHKREASAQGETTPDSEVSGEKRPKRPGPDEEAQKNLIVIIVDSPERASSALPALEGAS